MKEIECLEFIRYSPDGEKLRHIRCLAGRVSVFRAKDADELLLYRKAIEGTNTTDRFSLLLDGKSYNHKDHFFIGFAVRDESANSDTVKVFLNNKGVPSELIESCLNKYHLGGLSEKSCLDLAPKEWRMLRQLACLEGTSSEGLYFLHDPFFEFTVEARETFAASWAQLAWKKRQIVVITKLSDRPTNWIENDYIARIQLEKPRQATIGFGGTSDDAQAMIQNLRLEAAKKSALTDSLTAVSGISKFRQLFKSKIITALTAASILLFISIFYITKKFNASSNILVASSLTPNSNIHENIKSSTDTALPSNKDNSTFQDIILEKKSSVFSGFSDNIQIAWTTAMDHPQALLYKEGGNKDSANSYITPEDGQKNIIETFFNALEKNH